MSDPDLDLLRRFARDREQDAFTEIVRRHVNLVYSAALRQVRSPQLAEEVAQSVFADLARVAATPSSPLSGRDASSQTSLTPWLFTVTRRTAVDVIRKESRRQLREQIAVEMNAMNATANEWMQIEPLLDDAMAALDETDRAAVLLRYFENKSLREVGAQLGVGDDAAQKRVSRAVERLREFFAKRGVAVGAGGLAVVISANAVQAAPVGLAATISAAAALLTGTAATTSTLIAATTKTIAMTTLQKTLVTVTVAALAGAGIYEVRQAAQLREQNLTLQQQQAPLAEKVRQLQSDFDVATNRLARLNAEVADAKKNNAELLKLRGEITMLRNQVEKSGLAQISSQQPKTRNAEPPMQSSQIQPTDYPKATWNFAGYATPEAALQSWTWAYSKGDQTRMLESLSPEEKPKYEDLFAKTTQSQFATECEEASSLFNGYQIVGRNVRSDSEIDIAIVITTTDGQTTPEQNYKMVKTGNDWKMAGPSKEK